MRDQYINSGQGFMLVYSITSKSTFKSLADLREKILQVKDCDRFPMVIIGNKCDLEKERQVSTQECKELTGSWGAPFLEGSSRIFYLITLHPLRNI
jgi:GTPase KRas protein